MDEAENHHSQQTDTGTENQTPHILAHKWGLNNEWIFLKTQLYSVCKKITSFIKTQTK